MSGGEPARRVRAGSRRHFQRVISQIGARAKAQFTATMTQNRPVVPQLSDASANAVHPSRPTGPMPVSPVAPFPNFREPAAGPEKERHEGPGPEFPSKASQGMPGVAIGSHGGKGAGLIRREVLRQQWEQTLAVYPGPGMRGPSGLQPRI
jgi:hypothetical protein